MNRKELENRMELIHFLLDVFEYKRTYQSASSDMRPVDLFLLERIQQKNGCQTLELSRQYGFAPATLINMLDRLQQEGFIQRRRSTEDKRIVQVFVTEKGQSSVKNHLTEDEVFTGNLFNVLDKEDQQQLERLLKELQQRIILEKLFEPVKGGES